VRSLDADRPEVENGRPFLVAFDLPAESNSWPPVEIERLWVAKTRVKFEPEVLNTPFFVKGIALGDTIRVRADHDRRELVFEELITESGNSTIRLIPMEASIMSHVTSVIEGAGCSWYTSRFESYVAVNIPAAVSYAPLRAKLFEMNSKGMLGIQESAISTLHRGQFSKFP
jgi:hypothetical protein